MGYSNGMSVQIGVDNSNNKHTTNKKYPMIVKSLGKNLVPSMTNKLCYNQSRFQKFLYMMRRILNKMANEDTRTFKQHVQSNSSNNVPQVQETRPKNMEQATNLFLQNQKDIAVHEKSRLARIDEILGTKTYFQETKVYQQRISNENILQIEHLYNSHKEISREHIDILNPQIGLLEKLQKTRKYARSRVNLKKYPSGNPDIIEFTEKLVSNPELGGDGLNQPLIKFLGEQELYVRLALSELNLTIDSINTEKLEKIKDGVVIDLQLEEDQFVHNQQVYFRPHDMLSIYRINSKHFNRKLEYSADAFNEALATNQGQIQEVVNMDEIYECLQNFYYDNRVNDYLSRIENNEISYFFDSLEVSPDGNSIFIIIDLMDNNKEFVGLYKQLSSTGEKVPYIRPENALFNFRPEVALRNDGILYYIQRSQEGLYGEFSRTQFNTSLSKKIQTNVAKKEVEELRQEKGVQKHGRKNQILYKCKPFHELKILKGSEAKVSTNGKNMMSNNVLLQETDIGTVINNRVYLYLHEASVSQKTFEMQELTANNSRLAEFLTETDHDASTKWETNQKKIYTECHEILGVGYLLVRYCLVGGETGAKLKYGHNKKYANFVTFIPYSGHKSDPIEDNGQLEDKTEKQKYIEGESQPKQMSEALGRIRGINLPSEESALIIDFTTQSKNYYKLQMEKQRIIYSSPQNQYITDLHIQHASISNVYLLVNNSIESVYNRNSLYVHSLRSNVNPYSIYLDGFPIDVIRKNVGSGEIGKATLKLQAPLLPVNLQYTFWKKQIKEDINSRVHTETLTIKQDEDNQIIIKIVSNSKYVNRKPTSKKEVQPVILYLPSENQRLNQNALQRILEKGVMVIQIVKCRGIFGSTMIELMRGSKQFYNNYVEDIYHTIIFIKENISHRVGIYAEGPSSCYATLLLNIRENPVNQLFDCSVLHEGMYDTNNVHPKAEFFFGKDPTIFENSNPFNFGLFDPSKSTQDQSKQLIMGLSNIIFSTFLEDMRVESRKFINKLRNHRKIFYDSVYLKQFHKHEEKDIFNLAYLYSIMNRKLTKEYYEGQKQKMEQIKDQGEVLSRIHKDKMKSKSQDD